MLNWGMHQRIAKGFAKGKVLNVVIWHLKLEIFHFWNTNKPNTIHVTETNTR